MICNLVVIKCAVVLLSLFYFYREFYGVNESDSATAGEEDTILKKVN